MLWMWLLIVTFFFILLGFIVTNAKVNGGFKVETSWLAIALSPAIIWLLATGQLAEFSGFGMAFKLREASAKPFSLQLEGSKIEPEPLTLGEKEGIAQIDELIRRRVGALTFTLGRRGYYYGPAINQYLQRLTQHDFFRFIVFTAGDGRFRALVPAKALWEQLQQDRLDLVRMIEDGAIDRLEGRVTTAIPAASSKREALKKMDAEHLTTLPVVNDEGRFIGFLERDKLTSSILLELVTRL